MPTSRPSILAARFAIALILVPVVAYAATETFTYDVLGRLTNTKYANNTSTGYYYDAAGNRISSGANAGPPKALAFTLASPSTGITTIFKNPNNFAVTPTAAGQIINGTQGGYTGISSNTCSGAVAAGATCTIVLFASTPRCQNGSYSTYAYVTDAGGTVTGSMVPRPCSG